MTTIAFKISRQRIATRQTKQLNKIKRYASKQDKYL